MSHQTVLFEFFEALSQKFGFEVGKIIMAACDLVKKMYFQLYNTSNIQSLLIKAYTLL